MSIHLAQNFISSNPLRFFAWIEFRVRSFEFRPGSGRLGGSEGFQTRLLESAQPAKNRLSYLFCSHCLFLLSVSYSTPEKLSTQLLPLSLCHYRRFPWHLYVIDSLAADVVYGDDTVKEDVGQRG